MRMNFQAKSIYAGFTSSFASYKIAHNFTTQIDKWNAKIDKDVNEIGQLLNNCQMNSNDFLTIFLNLNCLFSSINSVTQLKERLSDNSEWRRK